MDANSLDDFCGRCSIIVNTAGPVMMLQDHVAQASFRSHCCYVDAAGLMTVKERMLPRNREIADSGLSFVISAGLLPGISELVPVYAHAQAKAKMDAIESVTVYYGDTGEWSGNAFREIAWWLRQRRSQRPGYFRKGEWVNVSRLKASLKADLGGRIGRRRYYMGFVPELIDVSPRFADCDLFSYACLPGLRTVLAATLVSVLPLSLDSGARLVRNAFRKNRLPVGGFIVVQVIGSCQGRRQGLKVQLVYEEDRGYWLNGIVPATVARMISQGKEVETGVHFLASAVDPVAFMAELRKSGVELTESFVPCE
jgi:hypothetical protein